jgi:hypothetical protein
VTLAVYILPVGSAKHAVEMDKGGGILLVGLGVAAPVEVHFL